MTVPAHECAVSRTIEKLGWDRDNLENIDESEIQDLLVDLLHVAQAAGIIKNVGYEWLLNNAVNHFRREFMEPDELAMDHECSVCNGCYKIKED